MAKDQWHNLGPVETLKIPELREIIINKKTIALSFRNEKFGAVSGLCNHVGGPLGKGCLDGDYIVCPWHNWKFHRLGGQGEPGFEKDRVPQFELRIEKGELWINLDSVSKRQKSPHPPHPLARPIEREAGPVRVAGISTTAMDPKFPRYSTSDELLKFALDHAEVELGLQTRLIKLNDLAFRHCEGYYSKSAGACTWPCSITQMDGNDQLDQVYEVMVHWADVVIFSTPIRWGAASSLYYKMVERMNCIQNQTTLYNKELIKNKVASFIITGGQDNVQAVAGQMLGFFAELGYVFPPFPYIAHSLGWAAENMERNVSYVARSKSLREGSKALIERSIEIAQNLLENQICKQKISRGGRKAHALDTSK